MIFRDGWYTSGHARSCCAGANSSYNIRMGRAKKVTGPFSTTWASTCSTAAEGCSSGRAADSSAPAISACSILATAWRSSPATTKPTRSRRRQRPRHPSAALARRLAGGRREREGRARTRAIGADGHSTRIRGPGCAGRRAARTRRARRADGRPTTRRTWRLTGCVRRGGVHAAGAAAPPTADPPAGGGAGIGELAVRAGGRADVSLHVLQAQQRWAIAPVANAGGYPGSPFFKITIAGTDRALAATADRELVVLPAFTGAPEQLWRIDQLADGTYRADAEGGPEFKGAAGAVRRRQQHADAGQIQP